MVCSDSQAISDPATKVATASCTGPRPGLQLMTDSQVIRWMRIASARASSSAEMTPGSSRAVTSGGDSVRTTLVDRPEHEVISMSRQVLDPVYSLAIGANDLIDPRRHRLCQFARLRISDRGGVDIGHPQSGREWQELFAQSRKRVMMAGHGEAPGQPGSADESLSHQP